MEFTADLFSSAIVILLLVASFRSSEAQRNATDPNEVEALKAFGDSLGISPPWDFSVDPCSGLNGWSDIQGADNFQKSSGIECVCNIDSSSFCHVIKLVVISNLARGTIAPEIGNLTYLRNLNLQANLITGVIPEEIGALTKLEYVTVASNRLSGPLPKSIGNLNRLLSLSIAVNNFSGTIPKEFGGLTSLTQLYMDSSGLGGELPVEFGLLQNLRILNMFDNNFNGTIPELLGNMSSLEEVKLFGNKFTGPIPSELGRLGHLKTLEIGEVSSGGTIPLSFNLLKNLTGLMLRNCQLTGTIPEFENLTMLQSLDLSSNNFTGSIPSSFASLPLQRLFLGNNKLNGSLPTFTSPMALDVSFNQLSGPSPRLNGNFTVAWNNFTADRPVAPNSELQACLETRNCGGVNGGKTSRFAINCGGPTITVDGVTFSEDTADYSNGSGTYYSSQGFWALTSSGYAPSYKKNPQYFESIEGSQGEKTLLYQSARTSPLSVRYLGLGMQAGEYTVRLHFAEIIMGISTDTPGLGRRFFDVFIQGDRKLTDFNIRDVANGAAKAVVRSFDKIRVSEGVLDIHLLWAGKGTCCAPFRSYGPLISAVEVVPEFDAVEPASGGQSSKGLKIGLGVAVPMLAALALACFLFWRVRSRRKKLPSYLDEDTEELKLLDGKLHIFSYTELKNATGGFSSENLIGKGAFGSVYKGVLTDGTLVAIKQLIQMKQNTKEFVNEATLISAVQHRNLVKVLGCCVEGTNRMLVLEFLENNSLYQALLSPKHDSSLLFDWPTRFNICLGIARGLAYLHEESSPRIIHRDIKANNVLLDKNLVPKIADFGLAKLFEDHQSHISTRVAGTIGYLAPEYALRGLLTEKADVYSYGVLALEIVSGRPNMNVEFEFLLDDAWKLYESDRILELLDTRADNVDEAQALRVIQVALSCTQPSPNSRPTMSRVVAMLTGSELIDASSLVPGYFSLMEITSHLPQVVQASKNTSSTTSTTTTGTSTSSGTSRSIDSRNNPGDETPWRGSSSLLSIEPR